MKDLKKIVEEYIDAINRRDLGKIRQIYDPQYTFTGGDGQKQKGPDAGIAVVDMYTSAFPDMKLEIKQILTIGENAIVEFIANGTHKGELMGISPTNRKVSVPVCLIEEFHDERIYAERQYFDNLLLMKQLGVEVGHAHA